MRQNIHQIILGILLITKIFAVGEAGAIFLLITPGAGPAGTGEAQVAKSDDAYASYFNPAGLAFLNTCFRIFLNYISVNARI